MTGVPGNHGVRLSGRPRRSALIGEGLAAALTQPVASAVALLIAAAVCGTILATTGQSAAAEQRVVSEIEQAGSRTLVFSDPTGRAGLVADDLGAIRDLPGVDWAVGFSSVLDVRALAIGDAGEPVPARLLYTPIPPAISVTRGRAPEVGEALVGRTAGEALGLVDGAGTISGGPLAAPVVGVFTAADPLTDLDRGVLVLAEADVREPMREVHVVAQAIDDVDVVRRAVPMLLNMAEPQELVVDAPTQLVDLQRVVAGELGASARGLMLLVLASGLVLIAVTLYGATANRRRDFGRRRALGASRSAIVVLVLVQASFPALAGAALGTAIGITIIQTIEGVLPAWTFTSGVATLAVLAALAASVPPAVVAAFRDPVRILRVP